jgi:Na+/melibiose symporter-like transporter
MAQDYNERSSVFAYSTIFGFMGGIACGFVAYSVFFPETPEFKSGLLNPEGYPRFAFTFGIAMVVAIGICVWGTRKEIPHLPMASDDAAPFSPLNLVRELALVFRQRSFLTIFFALLLGALVLAVEGVFSTYMSVHFWGFRTDQIRFIGLGAVVGLPVSLVLTPLLTKRFDKRNAIVICATIAIVNANVPVCMRLLGIELLPDNGTTTLLWVLITVSFIGGAVAPVIFATINSIFADICDEIELERSQRVEGIVYAARAFALKATSGLGAMIGGIIIDLIAFPTNAQPGQVDPDVIFRLGVAQGPATSIFTLLSLLLYAQYKLDRKRHAEIAAALHERRGERTTSLTSAAG